MNSLLLAVKANDIGEIQRLLTFSPICRKLVNYHAPQNHETPLFVASVRGYTGVVRWLLNRGARVDARTSWGATALHAAAERGHDSIIKLLLEERTPLHIQTQFGDTALHLAAFRGHHRVVLLLLAAGIDTDIANSKGRTALDEAEIAGHYIISKHLRYEQLARKSESANIEKKRPTGMDVMRTELLNTPQHPPTKSADIPCYPPPKAAFDTGKHLDQTPCPVPLETQARVKDWVMNSEAEPIIKTSPTWENHREKVRFVDEERPTSLRPSNNESKANPLSCNRRKAAMLKDIGKSHSCEGMDTNLAVRRQTILPVVDDVCTKPHSRCRRVNSLERAVEELQNELRVTRDEMERAKSDIIDIQDMMRLCWSRGRCGAVISDRAAVTDDGMIGQRYIVSPLSSDVTNPFEQRRISNPNVKKDGLQSDFECMSE